MGVLDTFNQPLSAVVNVLTLTLDGVNFADGGTATGFFTTDTTVFAAVSQNNSA